VGVWNVTTGQAFFSLSAGNYAIEELVNGNLATAGADNLLKTWGLTSGALIGQVSVNAPQQVFKQTPVNSYLASGSDDGNIYLWNINTLTLVATLAGHTNSVKLLDLTPSGLLVSSSRDNSVRLWNLTTFACLSTLSNVVSSTNSIFQLRAISNTKLVVCGTISKLQFISISASNVLSLGTSLTLANSNTQSYDFSLSRQNTLVVCNYDGSVSLVNANTSTITQTVTPQSGNFPLYIDIIGKYKEIVSII
jgi:WD40 repeat protein